MNNPIIETGDYMYNSLFNTDTPPTYLGAFMFAVFTISLFAYIKETNRD